MELGVHPAERFQRRSGRAGLGGLGDPVERVLDVVGVLPPVGLTQPFEVLQRPGRERLQPVLVEDGQGRSRTGAVQDHRCGDAVEVVGFADGRSEVLHEHAEPAVQDGGGVDLGDGYAEGVGQAEGLVFAVEGLLCVFEDGGGTVGEGHALNAGHGPHAYLLPYGGGLAGHGEQVVEEFGAGVRGHVGLREMVASGAGGGCRPAPEPDRVGYAAGFTRWA